MDERVAEHQAWPARAAMLALLGAALGAAFDLLMEENDPFRTAVASFCAVGGITLAFTLERVRWLWSILFALGCGLAASLVFYWNGSPAGWSASDEWRVFAAVMAIAIAAPLFQSVRDEGRWRLAPSPIHAHGWTNIVLLAAACAFVLISFLLAQLLAELFNLIGIELLREALRESWIMGALIGAALGAATGLLRDRDKVLSLLQRVATTVLAVLAPILAAGLVLFVLALPFTGLAPLWEKTSATTPILLGAIAGAFLLANAVIGNSPDEEAGGPVLRWSARALGAVMAPLALVAAISTWLRIDQYGFTPERLWALVFVLVVLAVSGVYLWTLARGPFTWFQRVRFANIHLALGICALALFLATPIVDFGAISTRDQLARLQSGAVAPDEFDWAALRFDFGPAGRRALERLAESGSATTRTLARRSLAAKTRWPIVAGETADSGRQPLPPRLRVTPAESRVPPVLLDLISVTGSCGVVECRIIFDAPDRAVLVGQPCPDCDLGVRLYAARNGTWREVEPVAPQSAPLDPPAGNAAAGRQRGALADGRVEVRSVDKRQVFIDGEPVGPVFDP